jgi:carbamoyltransferase
LLSFIKEKHVERSIYSIVLRDRVYRQQSPGFHEVLLLLVLGIHYGHGAAAALVKDGRVVGAVEEEKLNRVKGYVGFPFMAVERVVAQANVVVDEVDFVAIGTVNVAEFCSNFVHLVSVVFQDDRYWVRVVTYGLDLLQRIFSSWDSSASLERFFLYYLEKKIRIAPGKLVKVDHHLAHAASAFYSSPFQSAVTITADGKGDGACGGVYWGDGKGLRCVDKIPQRYSVGQFYQAVTRFLGFKVNRHEGKITGLAAYGSYERSLPILSQALSIGMQGQIYNSFYEHLRLQSDPLGYYRDEVVDKNHISDKYVHLLNGDLREYGVVHQLYQNFLQSEIVDMSPEDLAAGIQELTERLITSYARHHLKEFIPCKVCLAGGVFANVKVNQRIREIEGVEGLFVQPAMDDAGCALGAALHVAASQGEVIPRPALLSAYLGGDFDEVDLEKAIRSANLSYCRPEDPVVAVASMLDAGKVIGRYAGPLEWGPRALGNRSILVKPTDRSVNDTLNERLRRTEFMPFAPAILAEFAEDYLVGYRDEDIAARYMTLTYAIKPEKVGDLAAGVHIDGTARPQVVFRGDNPDFYAVIEAYYKISGIPAILNTSFNMHEEPIVNSPEDAIRAFLVGAVDVLSIGPFIVGASNGFRSS